MKLFKYGIQLDRLTEADIEMVRGYRNASDICRYMQFKKPITPVMQRKWFASIDNDANYYFIIIYEGRKIGLINIKNIDWEKNVETAESGLFLWDTEYIDSPAPLLASLLLSEIGFFLMGGKQSKIKILEANRRAVDFNKALGYVEQEKLEGGFALFVQTKESFISSTKELRKRALSLCKEDKSIYLHIEKQDWDSGLAPRLFTYLGGVLEKFEKKVEGSTTIYRMVFDFS